jgi:acetoin utilization protein AcuB
MRLQDIMETSVDTVDMAAEAETAWQLMRGRRIRHLVVTHDGHPVGVISDRDLGGAKGAALRAPGVRTGDVMVTHIVTAGPTTTIREAANLMRGRSVGCLPVLKSGKLVGIVTATDLLELLGRGIERPAPKGVRSVLGRGRGPRRRPQKPA